MAMLHHHSDRYCYTKNRMLKAAAAECLSRDHEESPISSPRAILHKPKETHHPSPGPPARRNPSQLMREATLPGVPTLRLPACVTFIVTRTVLLNRKQNQTPLTHFSCYAN
jgi:hypothetical protein